MPPVAEFTGHCARCHSTITATVEFSSDNEHEVSPPPIIGSYCNCPPARGGIRQPSQAVPLTLMVAV